MAGLVTGVRASVVKNFQNIPAKQKYHRAMPHQLLIKMLLASEWHDDPAVMYSNFAGFVLLLSGLLVAGGGDRAGELKKALAARTGLQPSEQQLTYKGRERKNSEFLDRFGVKNKSKLVVCEDPASLERRYIERQRNARIENANRAIGAIALEVDKLADQVYTQAVHILLYFLPPDHHRRSITDKNELLKVSNWLPYLEVI